MRTLLISKIREEHFNHIKETFSITLSPEMSVTMVVPHNEVISFHLLVENADECMLLDSEMLYDICFHTVRLTIPIFGSTVDEKHQWIYDASSKTGIDISHFSSNSHMAFSESQEGFCPLVNSTCSALHSRSVRCLVAHES